MRGLFDHYMEHPEELPAWDAGATPCQRVADYIAGMTDRFALQFVCHAQQVTGAFDVQPAKIGGHDAGGGAQKQAAAEPALEVLDAAGKRGLADVQRCGGTDEGAVLRERDDLAQLLQFE